MPRKLETEAHVKALVADWFNHHNTWHYAPIQNGLGVHGIPDRIGGVPIIITQEMVGKRVAILVTVESKRPGRAGEKNRGMTPAQKNCLDEINRAGGLAICCDGVDDLQLLELRIRELRNG
jgi:hypothetical protein